MSEIVPGRLLHLVFGGELASTDQADFKAISKLDIVGTNPNCKNATDAWRAEAHAGADNAHMRYFVVHIHRLMEPEQAAALAPRRGPCYTPPP